MYEIEFAVFALVVFVYALVSRRREAQLHGAYGVRRCGLADRQRIDIYSKRRKGDTMDKERVSVLCLVTTLLALTVVLAGCTSRISSNNTSKVATPTGENATMPTMTNATQVTHGAPVTVAEGQDFTVTLRTNPSTGYYWELRFDNKALSLTDRTFVSDPNPYNLVGVPGSEVFSFRALTKGTTEITFDNVSPSQTVTGQTVYAVSVT